MCAIRFANSISYMAHYIKDGYKNISKFDGSLNLIVFMLLMHQILALFE